MSEALKEQGKIIKGLKQNFKELGLTNIIFTIKMLANMSTRNVDGVDVVIVEKAFLETLAKALEDFKQ